MIVFMPQKHPNVAGPLSTISRTTTRMFVTLRSRIREGTDSKSDNCWQYLRVKIARDARCVLQLQLTDKTYQTPAAFPVRYIEGILKGETRQLIGDSLSAKICTYYVCFFGDDSKLSLVPMKSISTSGGIQ